MRSKAAILWFVVSGALAAALVVQWNSGRKEQVKLEQLQMQVEKGNDKDKQAEAKVQQLEKEVRTLTGELRATEHELNRARGPQMAASETPSARAATPGLPAQRSGGDSAGGGMGKMLATMMKDPEMRKAMEQQQKMGLEMIYGSLFKELQLNPEQEKKLREMLLAQQMDNMSQAGAMFGGEGADRNQVAQELAEKNKKNQEQLKELLGEEKYAQMQEYNQTIGERMMLDQLGKQADLSTEQNQQLLNIIKEEKKNVQINRGVPAYDPTKDWQQVLQSGEAAEQIFAQQEEVNNRVIERAGQVLTPEQLEKFGPLLKSQLEMQKAGMRMAREMFKGNEATTLAPPTRVPEQP
jgi:hypothetical protein